MGWIVKTAWAMIIALVIWRILSWMICTTNATKVYHISFRKFITYYQYSPKEELWELHIFPKYSTDDFYTHYRDYVIVFGPISFYIYQVYRLIIRHYKKSKIHNEGTMEFLKYMQKDLSKTLDYISNQDIKAIKDIAEVTERSLKGYENKYGVPVDPDDVRSEPFG